MNNFKATTIMVQYIKYVIFGMMLLCCLPSMAQQKKATISKVKSQYKKTAFSLEENTHQYTHKILEDGLYEVMVISPDGSLLSKPIKQQQFDKDENIDFSVNSKYWKAGVYKIIVEKEGGKATIYRLKINSDKSLRKR